MRARSSRARWAGRIPYAVLLAIGAAFVWKCAAESETYKLCELRVGEKRRILIRAASYAEVNQNLFYEVRIGDRTVVPGCWFTAWHRDTTEGDDPAFRVVSAEGGELVGVVEINTPEEILILHDFSTGYSWPASISGEHWKTASAHARRLLERLKGETPASHYVLSCDYVAPIPRSGPRRAPVK